MKRSAILLASFISALLVLRRKLILLLFSALIKAQRYIGWGLFIERMEDARMVKNVWKGGYMKKEEEGDQGKDGWTALFETLLRLV